MSETDVPAASSQSKRTGDDDETHPSPTHFEASSSSSKAADDALERPPTMTYLTPSTSRLVSPSPYPLKHTELDPSALTPSTRLKTKKTARIQRGLRVHWAQLWRKVVTADDSPTESYPADDTDQASSAWDHRVPDAEAGADEVSDSDEVDEVVVERSWGKGKNSTDATSEGDESGLEKGVGADLMQRVTDYGGTSASGEQIHSDNKGLWTLIFPFKNVWGRLWPLATRFFSCSFHDPKAEASYRKEIWAQAKVSVKLASLTERRSFSTRKPLAFWSSLFFIFNWVLACALAPKPTSTADRIFLFAVSCIPMPA